MKGNSFDLNFAIFAIFTIFLLKFCLKKKKKPQTIDSGKISANHIVNRVLVSKLYKELSTNSRKKQTVQLENVGKTLMSYFTELEGQVANRHIKGTQHH